MKIVIYTVLTGGYDNLIQPLVIDKEISYICFSNEIKLAEVGVWKIRNIPKIVENKQQLSRYPKMHPQELLRDYDFSLYIDANVQICDKVIYKRIKELADDNVLIAGMSHLEVDCAYEEGLRVLTSKRERDWKSVFRLLLYLKKEKFPYHWGMYEANCIFRNNHDAKVKAQCELWWKLFMKFAHRDQLSYSYTLWKFNFPFVFILPKGFNTRNCTAIVAGSHGKSSSKLKKFMKHILYHPTMIFIKILLTIVNKLS